MAGFSPIQHPVYKLFSAQALSIADADSNDRATSVWVDVGGWADKTVAVLQVNAGTSDLDIIMHISEQDEYTLNNKTCTTSDYEAVTIASALATETWVQYDSDDIDELQRAFKSARFYIENDSAAPATVTLWFGGSS